MGVIVDGVVAWLTIAGVEVDGRVGAEEVMNHKVKVLGARGNVVVVKVMVGAHLVRLCCFFSLRSGRPLYTVLCCSRVLTLRGQKTDLSPVKVVRCWFIVVSRNV